MPEEIEEKKEYDIKEAAELLGFSTRTIRKKLYDGELNGKKKKTKYGPKWFIPAEEIEVEMAAVDVVPLRKPISPGEFKLAVKEALKKAIKERDQEMVENMSELMEQKIDKRLDNISSELKTNRTLAEDRDKKLVKLIRKSMEKEKGRKGGDSLFSKIRSIFKRKENN